MTKNGLKWAEGVRDGIITTNEYIRLAVARYFDDIRYQWERGIYFDQKEAQRVVNYFGKFKHTKGDFAGKRFVLEPWQEFYLCNIYGWYRKDKTRRFNTVYLDIGRKNGKTSIAAIQGLYGLFGDREVRAEVYAAATKEEQARICLNEAKAFLKTVPKWDSIFNIFTKAITVEQVNGKHFDSTFKPLGRDSETQDGLAPSTAVIDEFHAHKSADLLNVIKSGMGSRRNPLIVIITTAGFNRESPCYHFRETAIKVLRGMMQQDNLFAMIFTLDEGDDWNDPKNWVKANPNLDKAVNIKFLEDQYKSAVNLGGSDEVNFKTKHLNIWTDAASVWIQDNIWMENDHGALPDFSKKLCWAGLDLASIRDVTALVLLFYQDNIYHIMPFFWIPEEKLKEKTDQVDYQRWAAEGHVMVTPGNATDYDYIRSKIMQLAATYKIKNIAYDRWNSSQLVIQLIEEGIKMEPFGQGYASMSMPTKEIEKLAVTRRLNHAGNPVLRWMCSNVAISTDAAGNIKMDKSKSSEKIDGMVALAMALGLMTNEVNKKFIYNKREMRVL